MGVNGVYPCEVIPITLKAMFLPQRAQSFAKLKQKSGGTAFTIRAMIGNAACHVEVQRTKTEVREGRRTQERIKSCLTAENAEERGGNLEPGVNPLVIPGRADQ